MSNNTMITAERFKKELIFWFAGVQYKSEFKVYLLDVFSHFEFLQQRNVYFSRFQFYFQYIIIYSVSATFLFQPLPLDFFSASFPGLGQEKKQLLILFLYVHVLCSRARLAHYQNKC